MSKKIFYLILTTSLLLTFSCSKKSSSPQFNGQYSMADAFESDGRYGNAKSAADMAARGVFEEQQITGSSEAAIINEIERKLVKRANIRIKVENLEAADASVSDLMRKYSAYAASTEIEENSRFYSLRVPAVKYDSFLGEMDGMGRMLRRSENTEDVTLNYYDLEGRLANKKELLKTYQSYLGRAKNIEEILSVEARITDLQNEIDWTGTQLRNLANLVDYATVELYLIGPAVSKANQTETLGEKIKALFSGFGRFLSAIAVILTGIVIYGIPVLILLVFFYWILFGRIGLLKKLWRIIISQKQSN